MQNDRINRFFVLISNCAKLSDISTAWYFDD